MKTTIIFSSLFLLAISHAAAGPPDSVQNSILERAKDGKNGVIVAVTERGNVAADTAWLLAAQVKNGNFAPLLMVLKPEEREGVLKTLNLAETTLPALIYYDRSGREISRVVGVSPTGFVKQVKAETDSATFY